MTGSEKLTYIFPHVPKCGGTSIENQLRESGRPVFLDYEYQPSRRGFHMGRAEQRNKESALLDFGAFDVVFGHFPIIRYQRPNYRYIALLRDPMDRFRSQYAYQVSRLQSGILKDRSAGKPISEVMEGRLPLVKWAIGRDVPYMYELYLDYWPKEKFVLRGSVAKYAHFLEQLSDLLDIDFNPEVRRRARDSSAATLPEDTIGPMEKLLAREQNYYEAMTADL